jgi:hypothetical protein
MPRALFTSRLPPRQVVDPRTAEHQLEKLLAKATAELAAETDCTLQLRAELDLVDGIASMAGGVSGVSTSNGPAAGQAAQAPGEKRERREVAKPDSTPSKSRR